MKQHQEHHDPIMELGNHLFPWRHAVYFVPLALLFIHRESLFYPFGREFWDEIFEFMSLGIASLGLVLRFWASGSSERSVVEKKGGRLLRFRQDGIFSVVRNPYFLAEFLIVLGLSIPLFDLFWIACSLLIFLSVYLPIALAREKILDEKFAADYRQYARRVPLFVPSFRSWTKSRFHFSWFTALKKEGVVLIVVGLLFYLIEQFRDLSILGKLDPNILWILAMVPFIATFILFLSFDPALRKLSHLPDLPE